MDPGGTMRFTRSPGRTPVRTVVLSAERRAELIERIRAACAEGRQAYWVCTLIDDSYEVVAQAAQTTYDLLSAALPELRIGLVHGRMRPAEKQAAMRAFKDGAIGLLVATTVIEVGVNVPNATLIVIEHADRFGLKAQTRHHAWVALRSASRPPTQLATCSSAW